MSELTEALDLIGAEAQLLGVDAAVARAEGAAFAAALAESATGAGQQWAAELDRSLGEFFDAAVSARRWRGAPTRILAELVAEGRPAAGYARALTEVAAAACSLGDSSMTVVAAASAASAAQLAAAGARTAGGPPPRRTDGLRGTPDQPSGTGSARGSGAPTAAAGTAPAAAEPEAPPERPLEELLAELDDLIGLDRVKSEIHRQAQILRVEKLRAEAGLRSTTITRHLVFLGNPGTGKTTVARLVAGIYRALGLLTKGHLVEVDRSELVAGYLGQTATKTADVAGSALGGVLFIDEAYSLSGDGLTPDQYGKEAIDTLVKEMEDHRDDLVVIVAGYPAPMEGFIAANPGLASRFRTSITFEDYTDDELERIFSRLAEDADYTPTPECLTRFREILPPVSRGDGFGNGRHARNLLEAAIGHQAWRLRDVEAPTLDQLRSLLPEDLVDPSGPENPDPAGEPVGDDPEIGAPDSAGRNAGAQDGVLGAPEPVSGPAAEGTRTAP